MKRRDNSQIRFGLIAGALTTGILALGAIPSRLRRASRRAAHKAHEPEFFMPTALPLRIALLGLGTLVLLVGIGMVSASFVIRQFDLQSPIRKPEIGYAGSHVFARQPEQRQAIERRWADELKSDAGIESAMDLVTDRGAQAFAPLAPPVAVPEAKR